MQLDPQTTELRPEEILRAQAWYKKHQPHVERLIASQERYSFPPHGSDCLRPELWKAASWIWFREQGYV